jgi:hypothetical protein
MNVYCSTSSSTVNKLSGTVTKHLRKANLREERFILIHSFRGFGQWLLGPIHLVRTSGQKECVVKEAVHLTEGKKWRGKKHVETTYYLQGSPLVTCFLQQCSTSSCPPPLKTAPRVQHKSLWGTFHIQP